MVDCGRLATGDEVGLETGSDSARFSDVRPLAAMI